VRLQTGQQVVERARADDDLDVVATEQGTQERDLEVAQVVVVERWHDRSSRWNNMF